MTIQKSTLNSLIILSTTLLGLAVSAQVITIPDNPDCTDTFEAGDYYAQFKCVPNDTNPNIHSPKPPSTTATLQEQMKNLQVQNKTYEALDGRYVLPGGVEYKSYESYLLMDNSNPGSSQVQMEKTVQINKFINIPGVSPFASVVTVPVNDLLAEAWVSADLAKAELALQNGANPNRVVIHDGTPAKDLLLLAHLADRGDRWIGIAPDGSSDSYQGENFSAWLHLLVKYGANLQLPITGNSLDKQAPSVGNYIDSKLGSNRPELKDFIRNEMKN